MVDVQISLDRNRDTSVAPETFVDLRFIYPELSRECEFTPYIYPELLLPDSVDAADIMCVERPLLCAARRSAVLTLNERRQ